MHLEQMTLELLDNLDRMSGHQGGRDIDAKWMPMQLGLYEQQYVMMEWDVKAGTSCRGALRYCT
jgi:hypothetical protein